MHVGNAAKLALQGCRQDDDRDPRTLAPQRLSYVTSELTGSEMVVEHCDINHVQLGFSFLDRAGRDHLVSLLTQDSRTQNQVLLAVIEQQDANRRDGHWLRPRGVRRARVGSVFAHRYAVRSNPGSPSDPAQISDDCGPNADATVRSYRDQRCYRARPSGFAALLQALAVY